jgi:predicted DNA-binding protein
MKSAMKKAIRNFHIPLPDPLYEKLREEAERLNQPATTLAREAIEEWLRQRHRLALRESISEYAAQHGRSRVDLDEDLEAASVSHLMDENS